MSRKEEKMEKYNNFVVYGYYGYGNAGDEALLTVIVNHLRTYNPNSEVTVISNDPINTMENNPVKAVKLKKKINKVMQFFSLMRKNDVIILGGGGIIQDSNNNIGTLVYMLILVTIAKLLNKKVIFYGISAGPINYKLSQKIVKLIINKADITVVRDIKSKELLKELGAQTNIKVTADLVFALPLLAQNMTKNNYVAISAMPYYKIVKNDALKDQEIVEAFLNLTNYIIEKYDYDIKFVSMQDSVDGALGVEVQKQSLFKERIEIIDSVSAFEKYKVISESELTIGMRLHSLIFAAKSRVPFIGISYHPKVESFIESMDMDKNSVDINEITSPTLISLIDEVLSNDKKPMENYSNKVGKIEGISNQSLDILISSLNN
ncbi:polysaccharide pyruvyl transferase CsaB [Priestia megaterium]|nr:polysaccharide pyruvyl transferase CsaB [Priestia megaterium]